jgi:hypothetical protein
MNAHPLFLILLTTSFLAKSPVSAQDRLEVVLFPYARLNEVQSDVVTNLLHTKRTTIVEEFTQSGRPEFSFLKQLRIVPRSNLPETDAQLEDLWNNGSFLTFLMGGLVGMQGEAVTLRTNIYLGTLCGSYAPRTIAVTSKIADNDFSSVKDGHVIPILFALALQAKTQNRPSYVSAAFLNRAWMIARDLGWDKVDRGGAEDARKKRAFFNAIVNELRDLQHR